MPRHLFKAALFAVLAAFATIASAADQEQIKTLHGLQGVFVAIDNLNPATEAMGLSSKKVHGDVALRLRQKGIHVFSVKQMRQTPGLPILKVLINVHKAADNLFVYAIDIYLQQTVKLVQRPSIQAYATTWKTGTLGIVTNDKLDDMNDLILDFIDDFASDYKQANPQHAT